MADAPTCACCRLATPATSARAQTSSSWRLTERRALPTVAVRSSGVESRTTAASRCCGSVTGSGTASMAKTNPKTVVSFLSKFE